MPQFEFITLAWSGLDGAGKENHWSRNPSMVRRKPMVTNLGYSIVTSAIGRAGVPSGHAPPKPTLFSTVLKAICPFTQKMVRPSGMDIRWTLEDVA